MKNKKYWLITSLVILLPILAGLVLWDQLPDRLPTHFGISGEADGWGGKPFAVFGLPCILFAFHWIVYGVTRLDKQNMGHNEKVLDLVALVFPTMSILFSVVMYNAGLGVELNMNRILMPLMGVLFLLIGNWLPKIKQNSTLGIKIKWTLYNEENWNKTHRFGGFTWVLAGLILCVMAFLPLDGAVLVLPLVFVLLIIAPVFYSWNLARKQRAAGTYTESQVHQRFKAHPVIQIVGMAAIVVILAGVGFVLFTGDIECTVTDTALVIDADYSDDLTVPLAKIDGIEYLETVPAGIREFGFGSPRLLIGLCSSNELGNHTRYTYLTCESGILLRSSGDILILNAETEAETLALYEALAAKLEG